MVKLDYDILKEFPTEIAEIKNQLYELKVKRVYEISFVKCDGTIKHKIDIIEKNLNLILCGIQYGIGGKTRRLELKAKKIFSVDDK